MTSDRKTAEALLVDAIEITDPQLRDQFIADRCSGDASLREEVQELVADYFSAGDLLEAPALAIAQSVSVHDIYEAGSQIGNYRIREKIGEGGMGVVFVADQTSPVKRRVALKLIKPGMDSKQVIGRFEAERQALATMDHPNIAKILDGGTTDLGHPYFVMELVRGLKINQFCRERELSPQEVLRLFSKLCGAIEHAHQRGILHRDLKPGNILVTMHDDEAVPKVIDFGVAKAVTQSLNEQSVYTGFMQLVGTPMYMSPEQLEMNDLGVDTRSDVYSLGVVLYEMLTGTLPFDRQAFESGNLEEVRRLVCKTVLPRPSERVNTVAADLDSTQPSRRRLDPRAVSVLLSGEIDWIVMKAMEKDRTRRYQSAREFSEDVTRFLNNEPILARPPSLSYRVSKLAKKHSIALLTAAVVMISLFSGAGLALWQAAVATTEAERAGRAEVAATSALREARRQTSIAQRAAHDAALAAQREAAQRSFAERALYVMDIRDLQRQFNDDRNPDAVPLLVNHIHRDPKKDLRQWDWYYLMSQANQSRNEWLAHDDAAYAIACHPHKNLVATAAADATVKIWNSETGELLHRLVDGPRTRTCVDWDGSGAQLAFATMSAPALIRVWDASTNQVTDVFEYDRSVWSVRFSHDGKRLIAGGIPASDAARTPGDNLLLFRKQHGIWSLEEKRFLENMWITSTEWSHDDRWLSVAANGSNPRLHLLDAKTLGNAKIIDLPDLARATHWHPQRSWLAVGGHGGTCMIVDAEAETVETLPAKHAARVEQICWSPDGAYIASCGADGLIHVFDVKQKMTIASYKAHHGVAKGLSWFADSKRFASVGDDRFLRIWHREPHAPNRSRQLGVFAKWADLATLQSTTEVDEQKLFWQSRLPQMETQQATPSDAASGSTAPVLQVERRNVQLRLMNSQTALRFSESAAERSIEVFDRKSTKQAVIHLKQSIDHDMVLAGKTEFKLGVGLHFPRHPHRELYGVSFKGLGRLWLLDPAAAKAEPLETKTSQWIMDFDWSPSGHQIAVLSWGRLGTEEIHYVPYIHLYDPEERKHLNSHRCDREAREFAWHPDEKQFLLGNNLGQMSVCEWTRAGFRKVRSWNIHSNVVHAACWHPNGKLVASAAENQICLWDPTTGEVTITLPYSHWLQRLSFSADGQQLHAVTSEGEFMTWDASAGYRYAESAGVYARRMQEWERRLMVAISQGNLESAMAWAKHIERSDAPASWKSRGTIALLQHVMGDGDRYRENCQLMLNEFLDSKNPLTQQFVAWTCAIAPGAVSDYLPAIGLAQEPLRAGLRDNSAFHVTLGAVLVRAGRFAEARATLENAETSDVSTMSPAYREFFLAMACGALRDRAAARRHLATAQVHADLELSNSPDWVREQTLRLLQAECRERLGCNQTGQSQLK